MVTVKEKKKKEERGNIRRNEQKKGIYIYMCVIKRSRKVSGDCHRLRLKASFSMFTSEPNCHFPAVSRPEMSTPRHSTPRNNLI